MKSLLKPTFLKVLIALVLFVLFSILWAMAVPFIISDTFPLGFPFQFMVSWGPCPPGENCSEFSNLNLILDVVFWYFIGAWIGSRFQKRAAG
jgi:hypothetical protein